ncbi:MAG: ADOP family duplicated permease [Gemmatimonadaceae bacterium]
MSWLDALRHRARTVLRPGAHARELEEEMRHHLELDAMQQRDPDLARRRFGNRTRWAEATRDATWIRWLDLLAQDARHAWRSLRRDRAVTLTVVVTLALGVGVNAAAFALLDRLYLRAPGGVAEPDSVRRLWVRYHNTEDGVPFATPGMSYPQYRAVQAAAPDSARLALFTTDWALREGPSLGSPRLRGVFASASYWNVLGVRPAAGRLFAADEDRPGAAALVAVVSDHFWRTRLGGRADVLGTRLAVGARTFTIVGVLPPAFTGLDLQAADVWMPLFARSTLGWEGPRWWEAPHVNGFQAVQRVAPGDPVAGFLDRATLGVRRANSAWHPQRPDSTTEVLHGGIVQARGPAKPGQELVIATRLAGVAALVLVIAVANVVNLLLARAVRRRREIAVRLALGVSRARLVRLLAAESLLLALLAAGAALVAGRWGGETLRALLLDGVEWQDPALDGRVALFTLGVALLAGVAAALVPALQSSRPDLTSALKEGAREGTTRRSRLRSALVVTQTALSVVLLVGAALFVRSLQNVRGLDIGWDAERLFFGEVAFDEGRELPREIVGARLAEVGARLRARPGVEETALAGMQPMRGWSFMKVFADRDSIPGRTLMTVSPVTPTFFRAAGIRVLAGAPFTERGAETVVNRAMAEKVWPGRQPLGQCLRFETRESPCYTVVGVVEDVRRDKVIEDEARPQYYVPLDNTPEKGWVPGTVVVRAGGAPGAAEAAAAELRGALRRAFPGAEVKVTPMTEILDPEYRPWRLGARLFTWMGLLALLVAVVGMYGTVSYGVAQRTHEFGVRAALGARRGHLVRYVVAGGLRIAAVGVLVGVALALASGRLIAALLYGVTPYDPATVALVAGVLLAVAVPAALIPAWRAARVDPVVALRSE